MRRVTTKGHIRELDNVLLFPWMSLIPIIKTVKCSLYRMMHQTLEILESPRVLKSRKKIKKIKSRDRLPSLNFEAPGFIQG